MMRHEQTLIYQKCIELMEHTKDMIDHFPSGASFLKDQLRRNTSSITLNYAEGYYQRSSKQKQRFFEYAIQSAREASACFDTAFAFDFASNLRVKKAKHLTLDIVKMISKLGRF